MFEGEIYPADGLPRTQTGPLYVSASAGAFQLYQYVISQSGPPSMVAVPAIENYQTKYFVAIHPSATSASILLSVPQDKTEDIFVDRKVSSPIVS